MATDGWNKFTAANIEEGKWMKTPAADDNYLKYRYHTGKKIATVIEIVFPEDKTELIIPSTFDIINGKDTITYNIDSIAPGSFANKDKVQKLTIKDAAEGYAGIKTIAASSFSGCTNLTTVFLPSSLVEIGEKAFNGCSGITNLNIQCASALDINANVFSISDGNKATLFVHKEISDSYNNKDGWNKFSNVVEGVFVGTYKGSIDNENDLTFSYYTTTDTENKIVNAAILTKSESNVQNLPSSIKIEEIVYNIKHIGSYSFSTSKNLTNLTIPDSIETIGKYAFNTCTNIKSLELPSSLRSIGASAFGGCSAIREIVSDVEKDDLFEISDNVFHSDAKTHATLYVPIGSKEYSYEKKDDWKNFKNIIEGKWFYTTEADKYYLKYRYHTGKKIATVVEVVFPTDQKELFIPSTFTIAEGENAGVYDVDSIAISKFSEKTKVEKLIIEKVADIEGFKGIQTIDAKSFQGCSNLSVIEFPSSLITIGNYAFNGTKITEVRLDSVETIGTYAFQNCSSLQTVWLPSTLSSTSIGAKAFDGCNNIRNVNSKIASPSDIGGDVFSVSGTTNIATLFVPEEDYDNYAIDVWKNKFCNRVKGEFLKEHVDPAKNYTYSLYDIPVADSDPTKAAILTKSPSGITSVSIPASIEVTDDVNAAPISFKVKEIGQSAFKDRTGITKVELPKTLTSIGDNAFGGCSAIREIVSDVEKDDLFEISDNVFHSDAKTHATLYVPIGSKEYSYEKKDDWKNFKNIIEGKWFYTTEADKYYLKYRYHTGKKIATVVEVVFPTDQKELFIPSTFTIAEGENAGVYDVDSIAISKFSEKTKVEKLIIEKVADIEGFKGIQTIDAKSFQGCTNLQKIWLPATLTSIGRNAFNGCNLTRVTCEALPDIEGDVFSSYRNAYLFVPQGATVKGRTGWGEFSRVYVGCYEGEAISSDDKKSYLYLKQSDDSRTAILMKYENTDNIISPVVFEGNKYDVTIIAESACSGVTLDNLVLPNTITEIQKNAFQNQKNLTTISLPTNLKIIGDNAFSGNSKLESLTFSDVIESIGNEAFKDCVNLKNVVLPSTLKTIGSTAFDGCSNLTEVISKITDENVIKGNTLSMPYAILYVPNHKDLYDGWNCMHILEGDKQVSDVIDGFKYAYSTGDKKAILINAAKSGDVTIPGLIKIGDDDYEVIAIDKAVFKGNTNIKSVVIEDHIKTIGANAFQGCSNLKMIELPASIKSIGEKALDGCNSLIEAVCKSDDNDFVANNVLSLPNATLYVHEGTKSWYEGKWSYARIYEGERKIDEIGGLLYAYSSGADDAIIVGVAETAEWKDGKVIIPGVISVGEPAVDYKVINIADNVFKDNTAIKTVEIGKNVQSIGANAFEGCKNLKEIVSKITVDSVISSITLSLPNAMLYVPDANLVETYKQKWTFADYYVGNRLTTEIDGMSYVCATGDKKAVLVSGITEKLGVNITIPGSITPEGETEKYTVIGISENAFSGNTNIVSVEIDENVKTIGANAFQGCSALNKVWIPSTLTAIGEKAFDGCNDIAYICTSSKTPLVSPNINSNVFSKYKATLYVPNGALDSYGKNDVWNTFPIRREGYFKGVETENGLTYECLINGEGETAETVAILIKSETTDKIVEIQPSVKLDGDAATSYNVTVISKEAFRGNNSKNNLEKLILPTTLKKIEDEAFKICTKLSIITSRIAKNNLFTFNENVFSQTVYDNATVYVPYDEDGSTMAEYIQTSGWNNFSSSNYAQGEKNTYIDDASGMTYDYITGVGTATLTKAAIDNEMVVVDGNVKIGSDTYTVTAIGPNAFKNSKNLKKLWLPASLTEIGKQAFSGCKSLTRVSTKSLPEITDDVFPESIPYLFIPDGKSVNGMIGWNSFAKVVEGHYVGDVSSDNISYICMETGDAAEKTAMLIKAPKTASDFASSVVFEENSYSLTTIGDAAFEGNTAFVNLVIPEGVKTIEANAFNNCSKLHSVELPSTLVKVGDNAFEGCSLAFLQSLIETPNAISDNVFADAVFNNATLYIPEKASDKYTSAGGWKNFKTVVEGIATEVTIEDMTYICVDSSEKRVAKLTKGLSKAKEVKVPAKLFTDDVNYQVVEVDKSAFEGNSSLEKVIVSEGIKTIGQSAFKQCSNLKSVVLPASLVTIGDYAFDNCLRLATVTCAGEKPVDISDNVFSATGLEVNVSSRSAVKAYKDHKVWGSFDIYYSMSSSGESGTEETNVATYQIVSSEEDDETTVAIVDDDNVTGDFSIQATVERNGITYAVTVIAPSAFEDNTSLTSVTIPNTISMIGDAAFAGCSNLMSITVYNLDPPTLMGTSKVAGARRMFTRGSNDNPIFKGVDVDNCILYVPEESIEKYKGATIWSAFKNIQAISATALNGIMVSDDAAFDVYNLQGRKVKSRVTTLKGLSPGVYIVRGKKIVVR